MICFKAKIADEWRELIFNPNHIIQASCIPKKQIKVVLTSFNKEGTETYKLTPQAIEVDIDWLWFKIKQEMSKS